MYRGVIGYKPTYNDSDWTLAGNPAITLPLFRASTDLQVGCQLIAGLADGDRLLAASKRIMDAFGPG